MSAESRRRPGRLAIGDRVRLAGTLHTVIAVAGTTVRLAASSGMVSCGNRINRRWRTKSDASDSAVINSTR